MTSSSIIGQTSRKRKPRTFDALRAQCAAAGIPVARLTGERTAQIPSATTPGAEYTVWIQDGGTWAVCTCPDGGAHCWHGRRALELYAASLTPPAVAAVASGEAERAAIIARGRAAVDDLCGTAAA